MLLCLSLLLFFGHFGHYLSKKKGLRRTKHWQNDIATPKDVNTPQQKQRNIATSQYFCETKSTILHLLSLLEPILGGLKQHFAVRKQHYTPTTKPSKRPNRTNFWLDNLPLPINHHLHCLHLAFIWATWLQPHEQNRQALLKAGRCIPLNSTIEPDLHPPRSLSIFTANWTEIDEICSKFQANISTITVSNFPLMV